jgi:hypothetical protein
VIDFLSTREQTTEDDAACARLLAAVIAHAIRDCVKPPNAAERRGTASQITMDPDAFSALRFLFGKHSAFPLYAWLIGADAPAIRRALLDGDIKRGSELKAADFRLLRQRLWYSGIDYMEVMK